MTLALPVPKSFNAERLIWSPDSQKIYAFDSDYKQVVWNLDFNNLLIQGCSWLHDYLKNNSDVSDRDRKMCDEIIPPK